MVGKADLLAVLAQPEVQGPVLSGLGGVGIVPDLVGSGCLASLQLPSETQVVTDTFTY